MRHASPRQLHHIVQAPPNWYTPFGTVIELRPAGIAHNVRIISKAKLATGPNSDFSMTAREVQQVGGDLEARYPGRSTGGVR